MFVFADNSAAAAAVPPQLRLHLQVKADNLINAPGLNLSFTDPEALMLTDESKAALRAAAYKGGALVPFAGWATPQGTPQGQLSNEVPFDRNGLLRTLTDLPGAWV